MKHSYNRRDMACKFLPGYRKCPDYEWVTFVDRREAAHLIDVFFGLFCFKIIFWGVIHEVAQRKDSE